MIDGLGIGRLAVDGKALRDGLRRDPEVVAVDLNHPFLISNHLEGILKTWFCTKRCNGAL